jgi:hypothetical protein
VTSAHEDKKISDKPVLARILDDRDGPELYCESDICSGCNTFGSLNRRPIVYAGAERFTSLIEGLGGWVHKAAD